MSEKNEWKNIASAPKKLSRSVGDNNYGASFIGFSKGSEPYICRWWWRDGSPHKKCNFITDSGLAVYPELWQPLPSAPGSTSSAPGDAQDERQPLFWYRPCSDGGYEGPIHNDSIEYVRKLSGAWVPLYPGVRDWAAILPKPHTDMRYHGEFVRGWNQCLQAVFAALAAQVPQQGEA